MVRVEDLMRWSCAQPSCWSSRAKAATCGTNGIRRPLRAEANGGGEPLKDDTESKEGLVYQELNAPVQAGDVNCLLSVR